MISFEEVYLVAHTTPDESREKGVDCRFIRINENWGIKFYKNEALRNKTLAFQARAAEAGLAPRVGECFELTLPFYEDEEPREVFGYVTECISDTYGEYYANRMFQCSYSECLHYQREEIAEQMYDSYEYNRLIEGINSINISNNDIHTRNVGFLRNRLVCIDFSDESEI